jgi:hypothetical protein
MFSHVKVASNDIELSKKFYDAVFQAVGGKPGEQDAKGRLRYAHNRGVLMVSKPLTDLTACCPPVSRHSLVRPLAEPFFRPDPHDDAAAAHSGGQGRPLLGAARRACP